MFRVLYIYIYIPPYDDKDSRHEYTPVCVKFRLPISDALLIAFPFLAFGASVIFVPMENIEFQFTRLILCHVFVYNYNNVQRLRIITLCSVLYRDRSK